MRQCQGGGRGQCKVGHSVRGVTARGRNEVNTRRGGKLADSATGGGGQGSVRRGESQGVGPREDDKTGVLSKVGEREMWGSAQGKGGKCGQRAEG